MPLTASGNFEKLKAKLRELFELDKADLDFGIYRIIRQRHREITEFLDRHLERTVREALESHRGLEEAHLQEELRKAEDAAQNAGITPEQSPRVMELRARYAAGANLDALADEVYSHLLTFFSRYYQEGDFLGLHRSTVHGREKYMIPYNGEEVKLVWANMDQYYIKSSELLRNYTFRLRKTDLTSGELPFEDSPEEAVIHFKLVEGDTEKDNRKSNGNPERAFALDEESLFVEENAVTLTIRFRYRENPAERNLQDKLNADTEKTLADNLPAKWKSLLWAPDPSHKGKERKDARTILQKHLRAYTARHQFDYFIHKDLGDFLRRELDFYLKNEVMHLDDIENASAPMAEEFLSKVRAIRRCAAPLIRMLAQLEDFQKKLWLKKKFVVETRYCLTLDRVPESLYSEISKNDAQWEEWERLYTLSDIPRDLLTAKPRTVEFLKQQPHMMLDTKYFSDYFTSQLIGSITDFDEFLNGICIYSDNYQAINLLQQTLKEQVRCIYIDPPYNTDGSPILYKNNYRHASWASLLWDRLVLSRGLLAQNGILCATIDDYEQPILASILDDIFSRNCSLGTVTIRNNPSGRPTPGGFAISHEYGLFYGKTELAHISRFPRTAKLDKRYKERDEVGPFMWELLRKRGSESERKDRPKSYYPLYVSEGGLRLPNMEWSDEKREWIVLESPMPDERVVFPLGEDQVERRWRWDVDKVRNTIDSLKAVIDKDEKCTIYYKYRPPLEGVSPTTSWIEPKYSATEHGTGLLKQYFKEYNPFSFPKSLYAVEDSLLIMGSEDRSALVLDFFAGSGTTGHAIINFNRKDNGRRKYILVEMGEYFDTVLIPRLEKVVYSPKWEDGKPVRRDIGISHAFKVIRLESYEDTLNNLRLARTPGQEASLKAAPPEAKDEYLLSYFLDVESAGSASLLNVEQFRDPFGYKLKIATASAGETKETTVDLVETFNWLIGLKVKHIDAQKGFLTVTGEKRSGGRTLIIWRTLGDDAVKDNEALEKFLERLQINPADTEFDFIYVNGSHTLNDPHNKVHLIEEAFHRHMFGTQDFASIG